MNNKKKCGEQDRGLEQKKTEILNKRVDRIGISIKQQQQQQQTMNMTKIQ